MAKWLASQITVQQSGIVSREGKVINLLFNFFEGTIEGIIGKELERRSSMVKYEETPLR